MHECPFATMEDPHNQVQRVNSSSLSICIHWSVSIIILDAKSLFYYYYVLFMAFQNLHQEPGVCLSSSSVTSDSWILLSHQELLVSQVC